MEKSIEGKIKDLADMIAIQRDCCGVKNDNDYMRGYLNGIILAESVFTGKDPVFVRILESAQDTTKTIEDK